MNGTWITVLLVAGSSSLWAEEIASRVANVTLYPGSAVVERELAVAPSTAQVELSCLPAGLDAQSLRVEAPAGVQVGQLQVDTVTRVQGERCKASALDERIRALEDQRAAIESESGANDLVLGYLKQLGAGADGKTMLAADGRAIGSTAEALRRNAQEALARQHALKRRLETLDRQLEPMRAERDRSSAGAQQWRSVRFALRTERAATLRLSYLVPRAGWTPAYRASLDSQASTVMLERQASIVQSSGEDWRGVRMKLSTGLPRQSPVGPVPGSWQIGIVTAPVTSIRQRSEDVVTEMAGGLPAPAPATDDLRRFEVGVVETGFATEFEMPGTVDLAADGQRVNVTLARMTLPATLIVRTAPRLDSGAYLVAEAQRPAGVWPNGPLQLQRDGNLVGSTPWRPADGDKMVFPFGRDERVRVTVDGPKAFDSRAGFIDTRIERRLAVAYTVHNAHRTPIRLQVLEASPVSSSDQIKVSSRFEPTPSVERWEQREGVVAWELLLPPEQTVPLKAEYVISYPKDARVSGLR